MLAFQRGDDSAFEHLVIYYQDRVLHFLFRFLKDRNRAEDLTQEVFLRVFRSRQRYRPSASFKTWLFTIASRLALNEIRGLRRRRRIFVEASNSEESAGATVWDDARDHRELDPPARLELAELEEVLGRMIEQLPRNQKAAVLLSRMEELSYREIAEALGVTRMAVKSLLMRARETLRASLGRYLDGARGVAVTSAARSQSGALKRPLNPGRNT